jgi:hypothetical protein
VNQGTEEYVRLVKETGRLATTSTVGCLFAKRTRSIDGPHHHLSAKQLQSYLYEFDFRYNLRKASDGELTIAELRRVDGKSLMPRRSKAASA